MPFRRRKFPNLPPPPRTRSQVTDPLPLSSPRSHSSPPHYCPHDDIGPLHSNSEDTYRQLFPSPNPHRGRPLNSFNGPPPMVVRRPARPASTHSSRQPSPKRFPEQVAPELLQTLSDLTVALSNLAHQQASKEAAVPVGPPPDPEFDWKKLLLAPPTSFPTASEGQIQLLAEGLLDQLPSLNGRDLNEVMYAVSVASQYPSLSPEAQNVVYQRLNLLYIAVHHGWPEALAASSVSAASAAVLPQGYQLSPRVRSRQDHANTVKTE